MSAVAKKKQSLGQWLKGYTGQKYITTILFLLIPLVLLVLFTLIPAINMCIWSFQDRDSMGEYKWIGFENYVTIFTDASYITTFKNCLYYLVGSFIQQAFALLIATILCSKIKLAGLFKGIVFFPYMMNGVAVSIVFKNFFAFGNGIQIQQGTLNSIIEMFGGSGISWLNGEPWLANLCLVFASVWRYVGFDILMYIGAIQSISPDIYEASDLDGANSWQRFWYITFPGIKQIVTLQLILAIKGAASVYEIPYIITGGLNDTSTFVIKTMNTSFVDDYVGLGCAMAIVLLIIIIIVTAIQKIAFGERKEA